LPHFLHPFQPACHLCFPCPKSESSLHPRACASLDLTRHWRHFLFEQHTVEALKHLWYCVGAPTYAQSAVHPHAVDFRLSWDPDLLQEWFVLLPFISCRAHLGIRRCALIGCGDLLRDVRSELVRRRFFQSCFRARLFRALLLRRHRARAAAFCELFRRDYRWAVSASAMSACRVPYRIMARPVRSEDRRLLC